MEYTKGPWEVVTKGNTVKSLAINGVCHGMKLNNNDAQLISASPDMYEAIQELVAQMPGLWGDRIFNGMIRLDVSASTIDKLMDAMSKAEGK